MVSAPRSEPVGPRAIVVPPGHPCPFDDWTEHRRDGGLTVFAQSEADAERIDEAALREPLVAISGAWLSLGRRDASVVLPIGTGALDLATLDAAIEVLKACLER